MLSNWTLVPEVFSATIDGDELRFQGPPQGNKEFSQLVDSVKAAYRGVGKEHDVSFTTDHNSLRTVGLGKLLRKIHLAVMEHPKPPEEVDICVYVYCTGVEYVWLKRTGKVLKKELGKLKPVKAKC